MSWWSDLVTDVQEALTSAAGGEQQAELQAGGAPNVQTPWAAFVTLIEGIWAGLTDGKMWRSLGWVLLGVLLMILGGVLLARLSAGQIAAGLA